MLCQHGSNNVINTPSSPSNNKRTKGHIRVFIGMTKDEKTLRALESFIESYTMRGACGAFVVPRPLDEVRGYHVHLYIDINWIGKQEARPHLVAKKLRDTLQKECKDYTGIDVYVTSSAKTCDNLSESMAPHVKRRLSDIELLDELTTILDYEIQLSYYDNASDAVEEIIDILNERILNEIWEKTNLKVSLKEKDELYWYLHNKFNKYITNKFNEEMEGWKKTKKKYIVKESQLERIKEYFDPIHYLKKIVTNAPKYVRDPESLKYDVEFQKVVNVIFKYTMRHAPVDNLKGLDITKVTPQGWGGNFMDDESKGTHTEWTVLLTPILPKWFNPDDNDYRMQMENFKKEFTSIAHMMGLSSSSPISQEGFPLDKVKFIIASN